jgi:hypothetical protein
MPPTFVGTLPNHAAVHDTVRVCGGPAYCIREIIMETFVGQVTMVTADTLCFSDICGSGPSPVPASSFGVSPVAHGSSFSSANTEVPIGSGNAIRAFSWLQRRK